MPLKNDGSNKQIRLLKNDNEHSLIIISKRSWIGIKFFFALCEWTPIITWSRYSLMNWIKWTCKKGQSCACQRNQIFKFSDQFYRSSLYNRRRKKL